MGKNSYQSAKEMLKNIHGKIGLNRLKTELMMHIGCDDRTIQKYMKLMIQTKLLKDVSEGHFEVI